MRKASMATRERQTYTKESVHFATLIQFQCHFHVLWDQLSQFVTEQKRGLHVRESRDVNGVTAA